MILFLVIGSLVYAGESSSDRVFHASLTGEAMIPPVSTESRGRFQIRFPEDYTSATFKLFVFEGEKVTQAHLHCGPQGQNGPPVAFLAGNHDLGWDVDGKWTEASLHEASLFGTECGESLEELALYMESGQVYVNVHSVANPGGELRGQVY